MAKKTVNPDTKGLPPPEDLKTTFIIPPMKIDGTFKTVGTTADTPSGAGQTIQGTLDLPEIRVTVESNIVGQVILVMKELSKVMAETSAEMTKRAMDEMDRKKKEMEEGAGIKTLLTTPASTIHQVLTDPDEYSPQFGGKVVVLHGHPTETTDEPKKPDGSG